MSEDILLTQEKQKLHVRMDELTERLDQVAASFFRRFVTPAQVEYELHGVPRFLSFRKQGDLHQIVERTSDESWQPLTSKSIEIRVAAVEHLEALWLACLASEDAFTQRLETAVSTVEAFLSAHR